MTFGRNVEKSIKYLVYHMPSHGEFLQKYCPANVPA